MRKILFILFCLLLALFIFLIVLYLLNTRPQKGALQVTSVPNSNVFLNGKNVGKTPLCLCDPDKILREGDYTLELVPLSGNFEPFQAKIKVTPKVLTVVDRNFSQTALSDASIISMSPIQDKKNTQINVVSFPNNSQVFLDSNPVGQTPVLLDNVTESDHEIKVTKDGYKDKTVRIRTVLGYKLDIVVYLGVDINIATKSATLASPSAQIENVQKVEILQTPTGFLRVRDQGSLAGKEIAQVKPGDSYELVSEKTGWYEIKIDSKTNGWISSQYAKKQ